jgi:hypothetical protein
VIYLCACLSGRVKAGGEAGQSQLAALHCDLAVSATRKATHCSMVILILKEMGG